MEKEKVPASLEGNLLLGSHSRAEPGNMRSGEVMASKKSAKKRKIEMLDDSPSFGNPQRLLLEPSRVGAQVQAESDLQSSTRLKPGNSNPDQGPAQLLQSDDFLTRKIAMPHSRAGIPAVDPKLVESFLQANPDWKKAFDKNQQDKVQEVKRALTMEMEAKHAKAFEVLRAELQKKHTQTGEKAHQKWQHKLTEVQKRMEIVRDLNIDLQLKNSKVVDVGSVKLLRADAIRLLSASSDVRAAFQQICLRALIKYKSEMKSQFQAHLDDMERQGMRVTEEDRKFEARMPFIETNVADGLSDAEIEQVIKPLVISNTAAPVASCENAATLTKAPAEISVPKGPRLPGHANYPTTGGTDEDLIAALLTFLGENEAQGNESYKKHAQVKEPVESLKPSKTRKGSGFHHRGGQPARNIQGQEFNR